MTIYAFPPIITCILLFIIGIVVLRNNRYSVVNRVFTLFCFSLSGWLFGYSLMYLSPDKTQAMFWARVGFSFIVFIPIFAYHFISRLLNRSNKELLTLLYSLSGPAVLLGWTKYIYKEIGDYFWGYYPIAGKLYFLFLLSFSVLFSYGLVLLYLGLRRSYRANNILLTQQLKCVFVAFLFGTTGIVDYVVKYEVAIYPFGYISALIFISLIAYAIIKYRFMNVKVVIANISIFIFVYALVLGIPFELGYKYGHWKTSLWTMLLLASGGPFLFMYLQRRAENVILQEEKRIQGLLTKASYGMRTLRNLSKLLDLTIDILAKNLGLENAAIFLVEPDNVTYSIRSFWPSKDNSIAIHEGHKGDKSPASVNVSAYKIGARIEKADPLVRFLHEKQHPVLLEEVKLAQDTNKGDKRLLETIRKMTDLKASAVVPIFIEDYLQGFIVLGARKEKRTYSLELVNVLAALGNQAGLAIENCNYIFSEAKRLEAEGLKERMSSLDHMAASMAHEIDNPMHIIRQSLTFTQFMIANDTRVNLAPEIKADITESLSRSINAGERVSAMVKAILDYAKMGTGQLKPVVIKEALDGFLQLISPQIKEEGIDLTIEVEENLPMVLGDRIQFEEIFMNFVRNSMHAVKLKEKKSISLKMFRKGYSTVRIECSDNGYGIDKSFLDSMFLSSTTTKGSSEGTGLGLYRVRKIVDKFNGKVWGESEGKDKGARLIVEFPVYDGDKIAQMDKKN
ncbi:MAG: GAF domain-containing protein [Candidatus Omnitrophica bacterium]|nr:GAF domain-containing protein [Candidatus Omnitrophota bacterium]